MPPSLCARCRTGELSVACGCCGAAFCGSCAGLFRDVACPSCRVPFFINKKRADLEAAFMRQLVYDYTRPGSEIDRVSRTMEKGKRIGFSQKMIRSACRWARAILTAESLRRDEESLAAQPERERTDALVMDGLL